MIKTQLRCDPSLRPSYCSMVANSESPRDLLVALQQHLDARFDRLEVSLNTRLRSHEHKIASLTSSLTKLRAEAKQYFDNDVSDNENEGTIFCRSVVADPYDDSESVTYTESDSDVKHTVAERAKMRVMVCGAAPQSNAGCFPPDNIALGHEYPKFAAREGAPQGGLEDALQVKPSTADGAASGEGDALALEAVLEQQLLGLLEEAQ